jgi:hypothetical protein
LELKDDHFKAIMENLIKALEEFEIAENTI